MGIRKTLHPSGLCYDEQPNHKLPQICREIKNSQITGTPLAGILGKIESTDGGNILSIVEYSGQRVIIPLNEMNLTLDAVALAISSGEIQVMGGFMLRLTVSVQHGQASIRDSAWLDFRIRTE